MLLIKQNQLSYYSIHVNFVRKKEEMKMLKDRINLIKKEFKYSNEELGIICGVSYTAIGNIINGITQDPGVSLFIKLSKKHDLSLDWLLFGEGEMYKTSAQQNNPFNNLKYLNQEMEGLKILIESKDNELHALKKIIALLESKDEGMQNRKKAG